MLVLRNATADRCLASVVPFNVSCAALARPGNGRNIGGSVLKTIAISLALSVAVAAPLSAQGKGTKAGKIPPGQQPPAGMCRIWLDGVPPGQQPAPTDCATAVRNRPANGRVIFGDDYTDGKGKKLTGNDNKDERRTAPRDDRDDDRVVKDDRERDERSASDDRKSRRRDDAAEVRGKRDQSDTTKRRRKP
jgi:hypothetical protein